MRNTSNAYSDSGSGFPEIEVLLATYNGQDYLNDFLISLSQQQGVKIHLRVSDDGSTDNSIGIVQSFISKFASVLIFSGPQKGPSANFFYLMERSEYDFVALADQDDIWMPNHLIDSITRLQADTHPVAMTFCQVAETSDPASPGFKLWPKITSQPEFHEIFFENYARGCTIVMKKNLVKLVSNGSAEQIVMHDWWIYLVAKSCGSAIFAETCEIKYRIHSKNTIGRGPRAHRRMINTYKTFRSSHWKPWEQLVELDLRFNQLMSKRERIELERLLGVMNLPFCERLSELFFIKRNFRRNPVSDYFVKIYLLIRTPH